MDEEIKTGSRVRSHVSVMGERHPMHLGIVVHDYGDTCDVDRMSLHGGAPWITQHTNDSLEAVGGLDSKSETPITDAACETCDDNRFSKKEVVDSNVCRRIEISHAALYFSHGKLTRIER